MNKKCILLSLISIAIKVGLNYIPISKTRLIFLISKFLTGSVLQC